MASPSISVEITGADALQLVLELLGGYLDVDRIADEAGSVLLNRIRTRFLDEIDADGQPWLPSKGSIIRRAGGYTYRNGKAYTATGTLFETGALFHSIQLYRSEGGTASIGTAIPYAKYLQEGSPKNGLPARPFLEVGEEDAEFIGQYLLNRIEKHLNGGS